MPTANLLVITKNSASLGEAHILEDSAVRGTRIETAEKSSNLFLARVMSTRTFGRDYWTLFGLRMALSYGYVEGPYP